MSIEELLLDRAKQKGLEEGEEQKSTLIGKNLLLNTAFNVTRIAQLADVSEVFVRKVKRSLSK